MFPWSRRGDDRPDEATLAARSAATSAFLALDDEQRAVAEAVTAVEESTGGARLVAAWAAVAREADAATEAYLAATGHYPLDGTGPVDRDGAVGAARAADEQALAQIERSRAAVARFRAAHARTLDDAAAAVADLPRAVREAHAALQAARDELGTGDGMRSRRALELLAEAERAAVGQADAAGAGPVARHRAALRIAQLATAATAAQTEAPRAAEQVRAGLTAVGTRRDAAAGKVARIAPALSGLRREFAEPCSRDLADTARAATAALTAADTALARARERLTAGDPDTAADELAAARAALADAETAHDATTGRLAELRAVAADPSTAAGRTRFVLRDAQRLVVDRDLVARFGAVLDAQAVRLQNAQDRLTGMHPDYWLYLTELRGVADRARQVIDDVRQAAR